MAKKTDEVYIKGKWVSLPALWVNGKTIVIRGSWLKVAGIRSEDFLETEVEHPELCVMRVKKERADVGRADIFTFTQKLPSTPSKYQYPMEWDSVAAIHVISFKEWWEGLPQSTRKSVRRSVKRGVVVTNRKFDDELVMELVELNNGSPMRQGVRNEQYGKTVDQVRKDHSSFLDRSDCICAHVGTELIGFLKLVYRGDVASILNLLPKPEKLNRQRQANASRYWPINCKLPIY